MPDLSSVKKGLFAEFIDYLITNNLTKLILHVLIAGMGQSMWELILHQGTVMSDAAVVRGCSPIRLAGWMFEVRDGQPRVCQANETHAEKTSGKHQVLMRGDLNLNYVAPMSSRRLLSMWELPDHSVVSLTRHSTISC